MEKADTQLNTPPRMYRKRSHLMFGSSLQPKVREDACIANAHTKCLEATSSLKCEKMRSSRASANLEHNVAMFIALVCVRTRARE
eukprot:2134781-Pleurochrysis_carterae.AAC.2